MTKRLYPEMRPNQAVRLRWRQDELYMGCCDCGLVHRVRFSVKRGVVTVRAVRDKRRTGQLRRSMLRHGELKAVK